jgi:hypothetical protein
VCYKLQGWFCDEKQTPYNIHLIVSGTGLEGTEITVSRKKPTLKCSSISSVTVHLFVFLTGDVNIYTYSFSHMLLITLETGAAA